MKKLTFIIITLLIGIFNVMSEDMRFTDTGSEEAFIVGVEIHPNDNSEIFYMYRGNTFYITIKFRPIEYIYGINGYSEFMVLGHSAGITQIQDLSSNTNMFTPGYTYTIYLTMPVLPSYPSINGSLKITIKDAFTNRNVISFGVAAHITDK